MELWMIAVSAGVGLVGYLIGWMNGRSSAHKALPPAPPSTRMIAPPPTVGLELQDAERVRIGQLLERGRLIEAIKVYRDATGVGLKEAKVTIEYWNSRGEPTDPGPDGQWPQLPSSGLR